MKGTGLQLTSPSELRSRIPPISASIGFEDLALLAEVAFNYAEHDLNGRMAELDAYDVFLFSTVQLTKTVLQFRSAA